MQQAHQDPTLRFSNGVEDYVRFRPSYPEAMIESMRRRLERHQDRVALEYTTRIYLAEHSPDA